MNMPAHPRNDWLLRALTAGFHVVLTTVGTMLNVSVLAKAS